MGHPLPDQMSSFVVAPVLEAISIVCLSYSDEAGGTLATPLVFVTWPTADDNAAARRNAWSMAQQKWQFLNDPSTRFMKVEDQSTGEYRLFGTVAQIPKWLSARGHLH